MADKLAKATQTINGTITPITGISFQSAVCKRYGDCVYIYLATGGSMPLSLTTSYTQIATIPEGFRPPSTIIRTCIIYDENGRNRTDALLQFGYDGTISIAALSNGAINHTLAY